MKNKAKLLGKIVKHKEKKEVGIVLKKSLTHKDFYYILNDGRILEWHISNIYAREQ